MIEDAHEGWQSIGEHTFRTELPNIFYIRWAATLSGQQLIDILSASAGFAETHERAFWIGDAARLVKVTADARKVGADLLSGIQMEAYVTFNTRFHVRVLAKLVFEAARLLQPSRRIPRIIDVDDEAAARAWIAQETERLGPPSVRRKTR